MTNVLADTLNLQRLVNVSRYIHRYTILDADDEPRWVWSCDSMKNHQHRARWRAILCAWWHKAKS